MLGVYITPILRDPARLSDMRPVPSPIALDPPPAYTDDISERIRLVIHEVCPRQNIIADQDFADLMARFQVLSQLKRTYPDLRRVELTYENTSIRN